MESLETILKEKVNNGFDGFRLEFQPQFRAVDGSLYGAEALARFSCRGYGVVPPDKFIPVMEETGMIIPFGRWVFRKAAEQGKRWAEMNPGFQMSINMSGYQFVDPDVTDYMASILEEVGLPKENVILEITETYDISSSDEALATLGRFQTAGMRVAIDDFGTGSAGIMALKAHPFHMVKVARQFVPEPGNGKDDPFLAAISLLAHGVGAEVCQEGIETEEQYEAVRLAKVEVIQGYLLGKPVPAADFERRYLN